MVKREPNIPTPLYPLIRTEMTYIIASIGEIILQRYVLDHFHLEKNNQIRISGLKKTLTLLELKQEIVMMLKVVMAL